ncbi:hypothetical protein KC906_00690 [Candidatus Kaiserbacteria bacterium]|nr:hypothetical protein [Candidatus Kaiserbacteria bacterium]MCB9812632.1 hypothetical protein [Candidatus Nomurabacteria bacterium]
MDEPQIKGLSYKRRQNLFLFLVVVFLLVLPALIFYTTGYRLSFENEETSIVSTGGIYVTTDNLEVDVFLDDEYVEKPRLFRSAYYIQNIAEGQHRIVVQRPDLDTWVKELPVDPHIVIEAAAFNMPVVPHVRPITEFITVAGAPVYVGVASGTDLFRGVSTTIPVYATSSRRTTIYEENEEYVYVTSLFSSTSSSTRSVFERLFGEGERFRFATTSPLGLTISTSTEDFAEQGDMRVIERDGELYARWLGTLENIPFYFCVSDGASSSIAVRYGQHVADQIEVLKVSTTTPIFYDSNRVCRPEIKLNRLRQDVYFYDFFPNSRDLVIMQLEDGLYVTEIDDRAWQNVQRLYTGDNFRVVVENNEIYIQEGEYYYELITEIEPS